MTSAPGAPALLPDRVRVALTVLLGWSALYVSYLGSDKLHGTVVGDVRVGGLAVAVALAVAFAVRPPAAEHVIVGMILLTFLVAFFAGLALMGVLLLGADAAGVDRAVGIALATPWVPVGLAWSAPTCWRDGPRGGIPSRWRWLR